jgi:predicted pyridoxine 5'-phosphate oxidase superfamily flavin-nucleotide-binding protein
MVAMPEKVMENIKKMRVVVLATVDDEGVSNAVPVGSIVIKDPETILIGDNFFKKTAENAKKPNFNVGVTSWVGMEGYQVKGKGTYITEGPDYETMKQAIKAMNPNLPAKGCIVMKVTDVYDVAPGPNAGNKIA